MLTGFGRGEARFKSGKLIVEIRVVTNKFFEVIFDLPGGMAAFEENIKYILQQKVKKGRINLRLTYKRIVFEGRGASINIKVAKNYYNKMEGLKKVLGLKGEIKVEDIITLPGVLTLDPIEKNFARFWPMIKKALDMAINKLLIDIENKNKSICADLANRIKRVGSRLILIKSKANFNIDKYRNNFIERVMNLTDGRDIDMSRIDMEVAIFAKNSDISEEISRLENHLSNFKKIISTGGDIGKKIDFITQELQREINTIGAKANDFKISNNVIEIKGEIEKIREQAKDLE